jgi:hypothetical protein
MIALSTFKVSVATVKSFLGTIEHAPQSALYECKNRAIAHILRYGRESHDLVWQIRQCKTVGELSMLPFNTPELFEVKGK